jgi:hypothetical protein
MYVQRISCRRVGDEVSIFGSRHRRLPYIGFGIRANAASGRK